MKKCPVCRVELVPVDYEGVRVLNCSSCHGYLVKQQRLKGIERRPERTKEDLEAQVRSEYGANSAEKLNCPRCMSVMRKDAQRLPVVDLHTDVCERCECVWLDGGELALLQLAYQASTKFADAQDMKRRVQALDCDPERKAEFEKRMDRLPTELPTEDEAVGGLGGEVGEVLVDIGLDYLLDLLENAGKFR